MDCYERKQHEGKGVVDGFGVAFCYGGARTGGGQKKVFNRLEECQRKFLNTEAFWWCA